MLSSDIQNPDNHLSELIVLNGQKTSGAEHNVWLNRAKGVVHKIPSSFGRFWQKMHPDYAERDLSVMREARIPVVPTEIYRDAEVIYAGQTREHVSYVLEQPLYEASHPLTYSDLLHNPRYRKYFLDIMRIGREIRERYNLGLDLLGGKIVKLFGPVLNPRRKTMPAEINNLLVADNTILDKRGSHESESDKDELIARKGEIRLCDTRMYDFDREGFKGNGVKLVLLAAQDAQDCANWSLLEHLGCKAEFDFEKTRVRRMIRYLMGLAIPKMRAYAEIRG